MIAIAEQIVILAVIGLIGYIAFKAKAISPENNNGLVKIIVKITLPLLIFTTFAGAELSSDIVQNFPYVFVAPFVGVPVFYILSSLSAKGLKLDKENTALHNVHTMFGNVVFLGFPLLNAVYPGGEGLIYAAIFQLGHDCLTWTWGIFILNKGSQNKKTNAFLRLINPATIAFLTGILFMLFKIKIPELIYSPLSSVGHTTIYLSMIYVGIILAQVRPISLIKNFRSYVLSLNKLLIGPAIVGLVFFALLKTGLEISEKAIIASVLQTAMPCMIIVAVMAKDMGLNSSQAIENIFISTVLSLFTLPAVFYVINLVFI